MTIKRIDDIEREKAQENRERVKSEITEDINDVFENVFKRPKRKKSVFSFFWSILKFLGVLVILITVVNFILGNIWLLKFFIKSLFLKA